MAKKSLQVAFWLVHLTPTHTPGGPRKAVMEGRSVPKAMPKESGMKRRTKKKVALARDRTKETCQRLFCVLLFRWLLQATGGVAAAARGPRSLRLGSSLHPSVTVGLTWLSADRYEGARWLRKAEHRAAAAAAAER
uniref:Putative secreted protein n=1 Tax=Anopheles marajoara TaxID=58244 RepID=A0A2M4C6L0_9DIPT